MGKAGKISIEYIYNHPKNFTSSFTIMVYVIVPYE